MSNVSQFSTSAASNNSSSPDGFPEGMAPSGVNDSARELMAALAKWYSDTDGTLSTGGSGNAYTLSSNSSHAALTDQSILVFRFDRANTGAATLNVDSLGAKSILTDEGNALISGQIRANSLGVVVYSSNQDSYMLVNDPSVITTRGDLLVGDSSGEDSRLAIGSANTVLVSDGTDASWSSTTGTDTVDTAAIQSGAVDTAELADSAVTKAKINGSAVTQTELDVTTASQSGDSVASSTDITLAVNPFFPMIHVSDDDTRLSGHSSDGGGANNPRFRFVKTGATFNYDVDYRRVKQ